MVNNSEVKRRRFRNVSRNERKEKRSDRKGYHAAAKINHRRLSLRTAIFIGQEHDESTKIGIQERMDQLKVRQSHGFDVVLKKV